MFEYLTVWLHEHAWFDPIVWISLFCLVPPERKCHRIGLWALGTKQVWKCVCVNPRCTGGAPVDFVPCN